MEKLSNQEVKFLETILEAIPNMTEFEKGYFLGVVESKAQDKAAQNAGSEKHNRMFRYEPEVAAEMSDRI